MSEQIDRKSLTVSVAMAAELLGISRNLAYKLVKNGDIPSIKLGKRRILIPIVALSNIIKGTEESSAASCNTPLSAHSLEEDPNQLRLFDGGKE